MVKKKFTTEEKIRAVELHIREGMGYGGISDRYGVPTATLRLWIRNYQTFGVEGLMRRKGNQSYSSELKKCAVEEYLSGAGSQADICKKYKIYSRTQLRNWIKVYNSHRELRPSRGRGSDIYMTKGRNTTFRTHSDKVVNISVRIKAPCNIQSTIKITFHFFIVFHSSRIFQYCLGYTT